jgi:endoglucanase
MDKAPPTSINYAANPDLMGKTCGEVLDAVIQGCAERGVLVMLDLHRVDPNSTTLPPVMWQVVDEAQLHRAWTLMATRYKGAWNVFAADLINEPHGAATWGDGQATDWRLVAQRLGDTVLKVNPRMVVFVEGIDRTTTPHNAFWGGTIEWAVKHPVVLKESPDKVVYSPHIYGPDVYMQPYFSAPNFPGNMGAVWQAHVGVVVDEKKAAVCVGEFGGKAVPGSLDHTWHKSMIQWFKARGVGSFYWCVNPNSGDTAGLLKDDWTTPDLIKLALLQDVPKGTPFPKQGVSLSPVAPVKPGPPAPVKPAPSPAPPTTRMPLGKRMAYTVKLDREWTTGPSGVTTYQYSLELINTSGTRIPNAWVNILLTPPGAKLVSTWSMKRAEGRTTFSFPEWLVKTGGLQGDGRLVVGIVTTATKVALGVPRGVSEDEQEFSEEDPGLEIEVE